MAQPGKRRRSVYSSEKSRRNVPTLMFPRYATCAQRTCAGIPAAEASRASKKHHHTAANSMSNSHRPPGDERRRHARIMATAATTAALR